MVRLAPKLHVPRRLRASTVLGPRTFIVQTVTPARSYNSPAELDPLALGVDESRTTFKLDEDGREVWSTSDTAGIFKGLAEYARTKGRPARPRKRHPGRNEFVSKYLLRMYSLRRSAKQIGSRIQEISKKASTSQEVVDLIKGSLIPPTLLDGASESSFSLEKTPDVYPARELSFEDCLGTFRISSSTSTSSSPRLSPSSTSSSFSSPSSSPVLHLSPCKMEQHISTSAPPRATLHKSVVVARPEPNQLIPSVVYVTPLESFMDSPRHIRTIEPAWIVALDKVISTQDFCASIALCQGAKVVESALVSLTSLECGHSGWPEYRAEFPRFWEIVCNSNDPVQYQLHLDIRPVRLDRHESLRNSILASAIYKMEYIPLVDVSHPLRMGEPDYSEHHTNYRAMDSYGLSSLETVSFKDGYNASFGLSQTREAAYGSQSSSWSDDSNGFNYDFPQRGGPSISETTVVSSSASFCFPHDIRYYVC